MIAYVEKGIGLHRAIWAAGFPRFGRVDGAWRADMANPSDSSNDAAVQAIIDAYDPLPQYKADAVERIKAVALARMQALFPALADIDTVNLVAEVWLSIAPAARAPTANMTSVVAIYTAAKGGIVAVNASATIAAVDAAVAAIAWPS